MQYLISVRQLRQSPAVINVQPTVINNLAASALAPRLLIDDSIIGCAEKYPPIAN